ncbi:permease for unsaturated rhamnogalacturonan [Microbacterium sp. 8M]|uniref:ABC transporter permease n=1 Tax=Microbacterium sp. 8M TaxID=2653153 RepID=UPI0012F382C0|nr:ABC transporter permease subunit [Microbacterium sp. 8M]VXB34297.1 permease for unsaturated rhamnogalacturonan [Microbacterium sp. 8M]
MTLSAEQDASLEAVKAPPRKTSHRARFARSLRRYWQLYLLLLLPVVWFIVFRYVPMVNAVIAFKNYSPVQGVWGSPWVGFDNFANLFRNPVFPKLLVNTLVLAGYTLLASFPLPIILALALNEVRLRFFKRTVQLVTYAPYFISTVVIVSMTILLLSPRVGLLGRTLSFFGAGQVDLLASADFFRHIYVATDLWTTTGYSAVIYLAALSAVDVSLYEAAKIDGASRLQKIWNVDIPSIMPTASIILILGVGNIMAIGFEKAFLLQNPLNLSTSEIIPTYVYKTGILNANFSLGATIGLFNAVIGLILLLVVNKVSKRISGNGLW